MFIRRRTDRIMVLPSCYTSIADQKPVERFIRNDVEHLVKDQAHISLVRLYENSMQYFCNKM